VGARVSPQIGLECFLCQEHGLDPRWELFLDHLAAGGMCTPAKRDAILAWHGYLTPTSSPAPWPDRWLAAALLRSLQEFGAFDRRISHVKITYRAGCPPPAQAYPRFGPGGTRRS